MNKVEIAKSLALYKEQKGLSYQQIEKESGISYAQVSNIINGKETLVSEEMYRKVAAFLKLDTWKMIETDNLSIVHELCWEAQEYSRCFGITGASGLGKTGSLNDYKAKNPNTYYLLADILMGGKKAFLKSLQRSIGIAEGDTPSELLEGICKRLNSLNKPLIIIDDAGKLSDTSLRIIQLLYDRTEGRCGIIVAGTPYLKMVLEKGLTKNKMGYEELFRRVEHWQQLYTPTKEEIVALCTLHQLNHAATISYICNVSKNFGTVRALISLAIRLQDKGKLTENNLVKGISPLATKGGI